MIKSYTDTVSSEDYTLNTKTTVISKEQLDACSTCDFHAVVEDGLSEKSRQVLKKDDEKVFD